MTRTERQMLGLKRWADANFRGTLCYGVGVGKTRTALTAIKKFLEKNPDGKVVVVVPTKVLKDQWKKAGAEMVITACPLCLYNLQKNGEVDLPVVYFTELLAEALGVKGILVTKKEEVIPALQEALAYDGPIVIDCHIDCDDKVFPMVSPGGNIADVFSEEDLQSEK